MLKNSKINLYRVLIIKIFKLDYISFIIQTIYLLLSLGYTHKPNN